MCNGMTLRKGKFRLKAGKYALVVRTAWLQSSLPQGSCLAWHHRLSWISC